MKSFKCMNNITIILFIKTFLLFVINLHFKFGGKGLRKLSNTKNLLSLLNITKYNMIRFVDYENLDFNSINIFNYFRKKYFNISCLTFNYDELNKTSKLEYIIGFYNENQKLFNPNNNSKIITAECFKKIKKTMIFNTPVLEKDKYYKCIEYFNASNSIRFGVHMKYKKAFFTLYLDFDEILNSFKLNDTNNTY